MADRCVRADRGAGTGRGDGRGEPRRKPHGTARGPAPGPAGVPWPRGCCQDVPDVHPPLSTRPPRTLSRRSLLVAAGALPLLAVVAGCTDAPPGADAVTPAQVDQLAEQVAVQEQLVAAYATAFTAAPDLAAAATALADQAQAQLDRLRAAAPSVTGSATPSAAPRRRRLGDPRADLRARVAAQSHATACLDFTGARAALLGSIAAGLRGQDGQLA